MTRLRIAALAACSLAPAFAAYQYDYPNLLNPYTASQWTGNGTYSASNNLFTASGAGGSIIFNSTVPGPSSTYEVRATIAAPQTWDEYVIYLRATPNANFFSSTGTFYAIVIYPNSNGACTAPIYLQKGVPGSVSALTTGGAPCHDGMVVRACMLNGIIAVYVDDALVLSYSGIDIASGQPGIGAFHYPYNSGGGITKVDIGHYDTVVPLAMNPQMIGTSVFGNRVDLQWQGAQDDPNGIGIGFYYVYRDSSYLAQVHEPTFSDTTVTPGSHTYAIYAVDYHYNATPTNIPITVPSSGSVDARQAGVRPLGSYWGGAGEQIDMRSGNLNYSIPLLNPQGRGGWSVPFSLSYNSQNWRQDPGGTWQLGRDIGYGYGWRLQAGSLTPIYTGYWSVDHYLFIDSTGAEYRLDQHSTYSTVWWSTEGTNVYYEPGTNRLHFRDGSFWVMGATSSGTEQDAGTMYPTLMQDSNGNQVIIAYNAGLGAGWNNSSSRINTIEDVRGNGSSNYTFTYNADSIPHLTGITNSIGTPENYSFSYASSGLISPFDHTTSFGTFAFLQTATSTGVTLTNTFAYDSSGSGELNQVTTPYGGHLRWTFAPYTLSNSRTWREVQNRYLSQSSGDDGATRAR
jgi:hypothetical protein